MSLLELIYCKLGSTQKAVALQSVCMQQLRGCREHVALQ